VKNNDRLHKWIYTLFPHPKHKAMAGTFE
jgi:hypothetical protein